jgi:TRAP-type transport system periplasmic protein
MLPPFTEGLPDLSQILLTINPNFYTMTPVWQKAIKTSENSFWPFSLLQTHIEEGKMKKIVNFCLLGIVLTFALSLVTVNPAVGQASKPIKLKYSDFHIWNTPQTVMAKWYLEEVSKRSGGKVTFEYFFATLTKPLETLPMMRAGAVDISDPPPVFFPSDLPLLSLLNACRIEREPKKAMESALKIQWYAGEVSDMLNAEMAKQNGKILIWFPMQYIYITKPKVERLADLKGLKMRIIGIYEPKVVQKYGVIPVSGVPSEYYEMLSKGAMDGLIVIWDNVADYKLYEVSKYASFKAGAIVAQPMTINLKSWNKLPKDVQAIFEDKNFRKEAFNYFMKIYDQRLEETQKLMSRGGMIFTKVDAKEQEDIYDEWIKITCQLYPQEAAKVGAKAGGLKALDMWLKLNLGEDKGLAFQDKRFGITR